jgi:hypothetical protein
MDDDVELAKIFGPPDLMSGKEFGYCKVFQVLVAGNHIDRSTRAYEAVLPYLECLEDHK